MDRRSFIVAGAIAGAGLGPMASNLEAQDTAKKPFKLKYAPHHGFFKHHAGEDYLGQVQFAAEVGFRAWEDNGMMGRPVDFQKKAGIMMEKLGIEMGVFVAHAAFGSNDMVTKTDQGYQDHLRNIMKNAVECAKRVNAKWCTVVPSTVNNKLEHDYQMANCVENLKVMAEVCEPSGLVMVLEPLNWWANHDGLFLNKIPQAYLVCKAVGSPSCKILDDLYHQQVQEGNLIPNMDKAWSEISYIQVGDNPGRNEPTSGEINYNNIFKWLHNKGYQGIIGMEHGISKGGKEGEVALIDAYHACDNF